MRKIHLINFLSTGAFVLNIMYGPPFARDGIGMPPKWIAASAVLWGAGNLFFSYICGWASDRHGRKPFLLAGLGLSSLAMLGLYSAASTGGFVAGRMLLGVCIGIHNFVMAAYCSDARLSLAQFSGSASLGSACALLVEAFVFEPRYGPASAFLLGAACFALGFLTTLFLPSVPAKASARPLWPAVLWRRNKYVYLSVLLRQVSAGAIWSLGTLFILGLGGATYWIGVIPAANMLMQFTVAWNFVDRFDSRRAWQAGCILSAAAWFCFLLPTHPAQMLPVMLLLGVSWSCFNGGSLKVLEARNPLEKGAALGLWGSCQWLSFIIGPVIATAITWLLADREFMMQYRVIVAASVLSSVLSWLMSLCPLPALDPPAQTVGDAV